MRCLVTGATGYIGSRLAPRLLAAGHRVRCLARDPRRLAGVPWAGEVEVVAGDLSRPESLAPALAGVDVAYYLVHSMGRPDFERQDRAAATAFAAAARAAGVARIVFLGGPEPPEAARRVSPHLRSRAEVARILAGSGVPAVVLRAAVIIGSGSTSFEMLRYLTERLPVMITPRWVHTRVQPIAIQDVLHYLVACARLPAGASGDVDIGGPEVLTYAGMMRQYAKVAGLRRRLILPVRVLSPRLSSHWVGLVTPVPAAIAKPLVASLAHEAVVRDGPAGAALLPPPPDGLTGFRDAVALARARVRGVELPGPAATGPPHPAEPLPSDPPWSGGSVCTASRESRTAAPAAALWPTVLAGAWPPGRGWRVVQVGPGRRIWVRAVRPAPGQLWWELRVAEDADGAARCHQRLVFVPRGLAGLAYWRLAWPARALLLRRARSRLHATAGVRAGRQPTPVPG